MSEVPLGAHVSVGVDTEDVARFAGDDVDVLFTAAEHAHAAGPARAARLAGAWCAKEAAVKALWPWVRLDPRRVRVRHADDGRPDVEVEGWDAATAEVRLSVSVTHTATVATAVVVAWGRPPAEGTEGAA